MTNIEQIKAEIDNWDKAIKDSTGEYANGMRFVLRHFAFILDGLNEQPSEGLEKEIEKYYYEHFAFLSSVHIPTLPILSDIAEYFYEQGKKAMKGQMMKKAIYADVNYYERTPFGSYVEFAVDVPKPSKYSDKEKVKIIIVKEDEN